MVAATALPAATDLSTARRHSRTQKSPARVLTSAHPPAASAPFSRRHPQELLPTSVRGVGAGAAASAAFLANAAAAAAFLQLVRALGAGAAFAVIAALTALGVPLALSGVPETKGESQLCIAGSDCRPLRVTRPQLVR